MTLDTEIATELAWGFHIGNFERVAAQDVSEHRWYTTQLVVFMGKDTGTLYGFYYYKPATEMQEGGDLFEDDPVPVFRVEGREVVTTIYARADG